MTTTGPVVCFGELLLRLTAPAGSMLLQDSYVNAHFAGAEANVAIALARLGHPARHVTRLPANPLGDAAIQHLRRYGVDTTGCRFADGRLGLYFLTPGASLRAAHIVYDRAGSAFAGIDADSFSWPPLLAGASRLHLSGITAALGAGPAAAASAAVAAARNAGIPVAFDGNYRASLWTGREHLAPALLRPLAAAADILFGDARDIALLLETAVADHDRAVAAAFAAFPNLAVVAGTRRTVLGSDRHRLSARLDSRAGHAETAAVEFPVVERIGGGDAFAAGVLHALAERPADLAHAAETGLALSILKHGLSGDASLTTAAELAAFRRGDRDVRR
ncbi:sugar kinase [Sandaracinobacteroides saxicola]|uniref:Sugar kinase n=1 Tax=Sandaracinobacteroides saxicola TaxID=2759707 RepID=A0A7G5IM33_9SPHN|nr:sugar kinase [Sandaracinobacteroides saxicola]QMW24425.1 sugar kinase [Sandaracinobacteroides saxicola]